MATSKIQTAGTALLMILLASTIPLTGCAEIRDTNRIAALEKDVAVLKAEVAGLKGAATQSEAVVPTSYTVVAAAAAAPAAVPVSTASAFNDLAGRFGEQQIKDLSTRSVLDSGVAGKFDPSTPCTRRDFIRWLVKANNALMEPEKQIRLAESDATPMFPDVPASDPDFKYIQGLAAAGYSIGYVDKTFKPDRILTREEMFAIKSGIDFGNQSWSDQYCARWSDGEQIGKPFHNALNTEAFQHASNVTRVYGQVKVLRPQENVSRAEAAVCLWKIGEKAAG